MIPTATLRGLAAMNKRLEKLSREEATKAGQIANRAGAAKLRKAVIANAPNSQKTTEGEIRNRNNKSGTTRKEIHNKIVNSVKVKKIKAPEGEVKNAIFIAGAYHASFVQFGSIHNTANPFMIEALEDAEQAMMDTIAKVLEKQLIKRGV